ncbi:MAG TPA: DUF2652 domain-containing protein [Candidatus Limnocylindrales bacterium]|nr:DUF2652 domain-containing protein [Candidatus Limnocylindrales bacterium]
MLSKPEPACLVIADISGYTGFLAGAELDHAQDILADLMSTVVGAFRPTFKLAKLEGDAAFAYAITDRIDAAQLQDTIERCYFAFRRRLRDVKQASTCECNACILVPNLDLKVVAHHGQVIRQRIGGWEELVGSDVIVVHRLLKNHVGEETGLRAYAMYSEGCLAAMGLDDPEAAGLSEHREAYEGVGEITCWVRDLEAAWTAEMDRARVVVEPKDSARTYEIEFDAPQALVWDWITSPARRIQWQDGATGIEQVEGAAGRRGVGTVNHCIHGKDTIVEEVLDWRPVDYVTVRSQLPQPGVPKLVNSFILMDLGGGRTKVEMRFARPRSAKDRAIAERLLPNLDVSIQNGLAALRPLIESAAAEARAAADEAPPEPEVPVALGRNLREPILGGAL